MNSTSDHRAGEPIAVTFSVNDRSYSPPARPIVVICVDGCGDEYLSTSLAHGRMPHLAAVIANGYRGMVRAALPSFTNVNNASITTGMPPVGTGFGGNFFIEPETGEEVMMNSSKYLRCGTILAAAAKVGRKVAMVTAKNKLLEILSHDLEGIAFSSEFANQAQESTHGIENVEALVGLPTPSIYSGDASLFVLTAGSKLIEHNLADFLYLSLTDYMQHKFAPHTTESLDFYEGIDTQIGNMLKLGAVIGITADHGMNAKDKPDGSPNVIYLESLLDEEFGKGNDVICPITDPYVVHHASLGSEVMVYLKDPSQTAEIADWIFQLDGITEVMDRPTAVKKMELPGDRIGDLIVMSARDVVIGRNPEYHDLSLIKGGLRSHGGRYEEMVPMVITKPLTDEYMAKAAKDPRNFDIFEFVCNGTHNR
tara:strand:- start:237 stop:1508 length:1272 start_codon:yes stop_codon:yes gene_type:complete